MKSNALRCVKSSASHYVKRQLRCREEVGVLVQRAGTLRAGTLRAGMLCVQSLCLMLLFTTFSRRRSRCFTQCRAAFSRAVATAHCSSHVVAATLSPYFFTQRGALLFTQCGALLFTAAERPFHARSQPRIALHTWSQPRLTPTSSRSTQHCSSRAVTTALNPYSFTQRGALLFTQCGALLFTAAERPFHAWPQPRIGSSRVARLRRYQ